MTIDFSNAVWAASNRTGRKGTVSEKVDVCITHNTGRSSKGTREYMVIRFYSKKYAELFKDIECLSVGFLGNYLLIKSGDDYTVYNTSTNPEIRIPVEAIKACGRDVATMYGGYLIKVDKVADIAYIDLSIGARA